MISLFTVLLARETAGSKHCGTAAAAFIRGGCYHPKPKSDAAEHRSTLRLQPFDFDVLLVLGQAKR